MTFVTISDSSRSGLEREREGEKEGGRERERGRETGREREREGEREGERERGVMTANRVLGEG